jgi:hypothetical protein
MCYEYDGWCEDIELNEALRLSGSYGPDHAIMQFTGLQDRNGKDIYIGDILLLDLISGDRYSEVKICEEREIPIVSFFDDEKPYWKPLHAYVGKPDTCLQVVGNIYEDAHLLNENPELLEND